MTAAIDLQLKTAYEKGLIHLPPEERVVEIASSFGFMLEAVKAKLMQVSKQYRVDCGSEGEDEDGLNFNKEQLRRVNEIMMECAECATYPDGSVDYKTRFRAAEVIRDDIKGRKDVVRSLRDAPTINILSINEGLQKARQISQSVQKQLTDVETLVTR